MTDTLNRIRDAIIGGQIDAIEELVKDCLTEGMTAKEIAGSITQAMDEVGEKMETWELFIPEVLLSARTAERAMGILKPLYKEGEIEMRGLIVLGTVQGDIHDLGKNFVRMLLEGAGFEVIDLGTNVAITDFLETVKSRKPDILGMSALLTTTMPGMASTIRALEEAGLRQDIKVIIGGAPVTEEFARQIGADGYGANAGEAVVLAKQLVRNYEESTR